MSYQPPNWFGMYSSIGESVKDTSKDLYERNERETERKRVREEEAKQRAYAAEAYKSLADLHDADFKARQQPSLADGSTGGGDTYGTPGDVADSGEGPPQVSAPRQGASSEVSNGMSRQGAQQKYGEMVGKLNSQGMEHLQNALKLEGFNVDRDFHNKMQLQDARHKQNLETLASRQGFIGEQNEANRALRADEGAANRTAAADRNNASNESREAVAQANREAEAARQQRWLEFKRDITAPLPKVEDKQLAELRRRYGDVVKKLTDPKWMRDPEGSAQLVQWGKSLKAAIDEAERNAKNRTSSVPDVKGPGQISREVQRQASPGRGSLLERMKAIKAKGK